MSQSDVWRRRGKRGAEEYRSSGRHWLSLIRNKRQSLQADGSSNDANGIKVKEQQDEYFED